MKRMSSNWKLFCEEICNTVRPLPPYNGENFLTVSVLYPMELHVYALCSVAMPTTQASSTVARSPCSAPYSPIPYTMTTLAPSTLPLNIDMQFHWKRDRVFQQISPVLRRRGSESLADLFTEPLRVNTHLLRLPFPPYFTTFTAHATRRLVYLTEISSPP